MASTKILGPALVGAALGLLTGLGLFARAVLLEQIAPPCPSGWHAIRRAGLSGANLLVACAPSERAAADGHATTAPARTPYVALYRGDTLAAARLATLVGSDVARRGDNAEGPAPSAPSALETAPDTETPPRPGLVAWSHTTEVSSEIPLQADVYFLSSGHRFGLLTIVHTHGHAFAAPQTTARWMETIEGTAPWGAPTPAIALRARCPEGFAELERGANPRTIVRCMQGAGTSSFATLSFTWDDGGFGSDDDRSRVATALAERVAQAQGTQARVTLAPEPFTLARNVDAIHTVVATGESVHPTVRVYGVAAPNGDSTLFVLGASEPDEQTPAAATALLLAAHADRKPSFLARRSNASLVAVGTLALGALAGALVGARRARPAAG